jgi:hypothetical protein
MAAQCQEAQANDLAIKSKLRPGKEMLYLSELIDLTDISYTSYDVCRGAKTEVFDLNRQEISDAAKASFDSGARSLERRRCAMWLVPDPNETARRPVS